MKLFIKYGMHFYDELVLTFVYSYQMQRSLSFTTQIHKYVWGTKDDNLHSILLFYKIGNTEVRNDMQQPTLVRTLTFLKG